MTIKEKFMGVQYVLSLKIVLMKVWSLIFKFYGEVKMVKI